MNLFGRTWDRLLGGGHRTWGPVTVYAFHTAMRGAVNLRTRYGVLCLCLPALGQRGPWRPYIYLSPNSTPWAATWGTGSGFGREDRRRARVLRSLWGHGYDPVVHDPQILDLAISAVESKGRLGTLESLSRMCSERAEW